MLLTQAIHILQLSHESSKDANEVKKAYKRMILQCHPDKSSQPDSLVKTQLLNEAKDFLLSLLQIDTPAPSTQTSEQPRTTKQSSRPFDEEDEMDRENIKKVREWIPQMDDATEEARAEFHKWFETTCASYNNERLFHSSTWQPAMFEYSDKIQEMRRRKRYAANRKKRAEGARVHRKVDSYKEGRLLVQEIKKFLKENMESVQESCVTAEAIQERFFVSQDSISDHGKHMFQRHYRSILMKEFPGAKVVQKKKRICYQHISWKS